WDSKAEAAAYAKLGHWLLAQKMARDAAQAYETAVALGDSDPETLFKRIYAYCSIADPDNPKTQTIGGQIEYSAFSRRIQQLVEAPKFFPNFLRNANRALAYAEELLSREWRPAPGTINATDYSFAGRAAMMGCQLLVAGHRLQMHLKHPGELASLRERTEFLARFHLRQLRRTFTEFRLAFYVGYWAATPDEAVNLWLEFLKPRPDIRTVGDIHEQFLRRTINTEFSVSGNLQSFARTPSWPLIIDWSSADNARGDAAWQRLLKTLKDSPALASKGDGFTLEIYTQKDPKDCEKLLVRYLDMLEQNRASLAIPNEPRALLFYDPRVRNLQRNADTAKRFVSVFECLFDGSSKINPEVFSSISTHVEAYLALTNGKTRILPRDEARMLQSAIQHYIERLKASGEKVDRTSVFSSQLLDILAVIQHAYPDESTIPAPREIPQNILADAIPLRFLSLEKENAPKDKHYWPRNRSITTDGENLFVELSPLLGCPLVVRSDLSRWKIPAVPQELSNKFLDGDKFPNASLIPAEDGLYVQSPRGVLLRYNYGATAWEDISALLGGHNDRLVGVVKNTLYGANPGDGFTLGQFQNGVFNLIASSRRRPAEHPLDELAGASVNKVFPGGQGRPCAIMLFPNHSEIHDLELKKRLFSLGNTRKFTMSGRTPILEDFSVVVAIDPDSGVPRALIRRPYPKWYNTDILKDDLPPETVWDWPKDIPVDFYQGVNFVSTSFAV
ncbi:MAG: hypothetical protein ABI318_18300, partial [Chthoniobacteraceae bacterium]